MDLIGKGLYHIPQEGCALHLPGTFVELDVGELGDPVDSQEHDELAIGVAEFSTVDVDIADLVSLEPFALLVAVFDRQPGDAMALKATVKRTPAEMGDGILQANWAQPI